MKEEEPERSQRWRPCLTRPHLASPALAPPAVLCPPLYAQRTHAYRVQGPYCCAEGQTHLTSATGPLRCPCPGLVPHLPAGTCRAPPTAPCCMTACCGPSTRSGRCWRRSSSRRCPCSRWGVWGAVRGSGYMYKLVCTTSAQVFITPLPSGLAWPPLLPLRLYTVSLTPLKRNPEISRILPSTLRSVPTGPACILLALQHASLFYFLAPVPNSSPALHHHHHDNPRVPPLPFAPPSSWTGWACRT